MTSKEIQSASTRELHERESELSGYGEGGCSCPYCSEARQERAEIMEEIDRRQWKKVCEIGFAGAACVLAFIIYFLTR